MTNDFKKDFFHYLTWLKKCMAIRIKISRMAEIIGLSIKRETFTIPSASKF